MIISCKFSWIQEQQILKFKAARNCGTRTLSRGCCSEDCSSHEAKTGEESSETGKNRTHCHRAYGTQPSARETHGAHRGAAAPSLGLLRGPRPPMGETHLHFGGTGQRGQAPRGHVG